MSISKEDLLNSEFLNQFKNFKEFSTFMEKMYVRGVEKLLEAEFNNCLGYENYFMS